MSSSSLFSLLLLLIFPLLLNGAVRQFRYELSVLNNFPSDRLVIGMNGQSPGPAIVCEEGDTVEVLVTNNFTREKRQRFPYIDNTTLHWHGINQQETPWADGVPGLTQCVIPSETRMLYRFKVEYAGTYWFHGHYHDQWANGLLAPLIVKEKTRPDPSFYKGELVLLLHEWYNTDYRELSRFFLSPQSRGIPPLLDDMMVNGKRSKQLFTHIPRDATIRMRIINGSPLSLLKFSIDGLKLYIIELDGRRVEPLPVSSVHLNVAQRASVLVKMSEQTEKVKSQTAFYFRVEFNPQMYAALTDAIRNRTGDSGMTFFDPLYLGIISTRKNNQDLPRYSVDDDSMKAVENPSDDNNQQQQPIDPHPQDRNHLDARPVVYKPAPEPTAYLPLSLDFQTQNGIRLAFINGVGYSEFHHNKLGTNPLLHYLINNQQPPPELPADKQIISKDNDGLYYIRRGEVVEMLITNQDFAQHPMHLHSFHFWIIATSEYPEADKLGPNYLQRDTVSVPGRGWARLRFVADQPGVWLIHCHILAHQHAGLQAVFVVAPDQLSQNPRYRVPIQHQRICGRSFDYTPPEPYPANTIRSAMEVFYESSGMGKGVLIAIITVLSVVGLSCCVATFALLRFCLYKRASKKQQNSENNQQQVIEDVNFDANQKESQQHEKGEIGVNNNRSTLTIIASPTSCARRNSNSELA